MSTQNEVKQMQHLTLPLYNLGCGSGNALTAEHILTQQSGVIEVYANPATEMAYIEYDPALTNENELATVVQKIGYGPTKDT